MAYSVAVIGLGAMGMGAAQSCVRAGLDTYGVDLSAQARDVLQAAGTKAVAASADDFADKLDAVLLLVVNAAQVEAVLFGESKLADKLKPGTAVMVFSTIAAQDARRFGEALAARGLLMLDAPVSGGAAKAAAGDYEIGRASCRERV